MRSSEVWERTVGMALQLRGDVLVMGLVEWMGTPPLDRMERFSSIWRAMHWEWEDLGWVERGSTGIWVTDWVTDVNVPVLWLGARLEGD